ncbi:MAG TPA: copper resistance CopC family protein [Jiangellaceae bacterium]
MRSLRTRVAGIVAFAAAPATVLAVVLSVVTASPATAHNTLISSSPEDGSTATTQPGVVELTFDQPVQNRFAQVAVVDPDERTYQSGDPEIVGATVTQAVDDLPDGEYTIAYRVVSADGHPVSGTVTFTMAAGGTSSPSASTDGPATDGPATDGSATDSASASPAGSATATADATSAVVGGEGGTGPSTVWLVVIIAAAAAGVVGIAFLAAGGRRRPHRGDTGS